MNILNPMALEKLLVANWTKIINSTTMTAFALTCIRDSRHTFKTAERKIQTRSKGFKFTISRFEPIDNIFEVWLEFNMDTDEELVSGTCEFHLNLDGSAKNVQTTGIIFK